jgi:hypothetical protein
MPSEVVRGDIADRALAAAVAAAPPAWDLVAEAVVAVVVGVAGSELDRRTAYNRSTK